MVARTVGNLAGNLVKRGLDASGMKASSVLKSMFASIVSRTILLLGILFGVSQLGVEIGPVLAGIGIIGFAVGFALQDTLSNFAAGTMLLIYRPFDSGDVINAGGVTGTVSELSLVNTTLHTSTTGGSWFRTARSGRHHHQRHRAIRTPGRHHRACLSGGTCGPGRSGADHRGGGGRAGAGRTGAEHPH